MKTKLLFLFAIFSVVCSAQIIPVPDTQLKILLTTTNCADLNGDGVFDSDVDVNNDGQIQLSEALNVVGLHLDNELYDEGNEMIISNLTGLEAFANLTELTISKINLNVGQLNFTTFTLLESLIVTKADSDGFSVVNASNLSNLTTLNLTVIRPYDYELPNDKVQVNLMGCSSLETLNYYNSFLSFNFCEIPHLKNLDCSYLEGGEPDGGIFDFTCLTALETLNVDENFIEVLIIKNGSVLNEITWNYWDYIDYPQFVCIDDTPEEFNQILSLEGIGPETVINEYCNFELGGAIHNLAGTILYDANANGCNAGDVAVPNLTFYVEDNVYNRYISSNESGNYSTFLYDANTTITPVLENPTSFAVSPTAFSINESEFEISMTQNFCITSTAASDVLTVYILPIGPARQGLNSKYKIVYKNIGTSVLSGELDLSYMANYMNLLTSSPNFSENNLGVLKYLYANLQPFETREIEIIFNLNSALGPYPLFAGDVLTFNLIGRFGPDQSLEDEFEMIQTVEDAPFSCSLVGINGPSIPNEFIDEFVHYLVNFENPENSSIQNLAMKINLDPNKFDLSTLKPVYSNHTFSSRISPNGKVEFYFKDINLTADNSNKNVHLLYKVKPKSTVVEGDVLLASANAYYNNAGQITSNVFASEIQAPLGLEEINKQKIRFYPNPVTDVLHFEMNENSTQIDVFDVTGKKIMSSPGTDNKIDLSKLNKGYYIVKVFTEDSFYVFNVIKE